MKYKRQFAAVSAIAATTYGIAAERCANETGDGKYNAVINVSSISPTDIQSGAQAAWEKIAAAAAPLGSDMATGVVNLTIYTTVLGKKVAIPGTFPMDNLGSKSFQASILEYRGIPLPGGKDPSPCDPDKNSCCEECAAGYGLVDPYDVLRSGFHSKSSREIYLRRGDGLGLTRRYLA